MNQDGEHLRLLSIFHYIVAALAALFSFFPLLYTTVGAIFICVARHAAAAGPKPGEEAPPEFIGWILAVVGSLLFLLGIAIAICILIAGRSLAKHTHYWFAFAMACIECLFIPFGTILGVFTIIVLSRESVKTLFSTTAGEQGTTAS
jgi:cytochrome bd-type quinol oxidase subunit 2